MGSRILLGLGRGHAMEKPEKQEDFAMEQLFDVFRSANHSIKPIT
jgi:hypothetical protein